jgi:hypothetical protein
MDRLLLLSTLLFTACAGLEDTLEVGDEEPAADAATGSVPYIGSADDWFFEIDGDYGSVIDNRSPNNGGHNLDANEVTDGGVTTWGNRDYGNCTHWTHTATAPYMGSQAYSVFCTAPGDPNVIKGRSEQHFLTDWRPGIDNARSLSLAFRLRGVPTIPTSAGGGFIAQLHGEGIPFILRWEAVPNEGYFLRAEVRYDWKSPYDFTVTELSPPHFYSVPITPDTWNRVMIGIDLRLSTTECPGSIGEDTTISIMRMDNATGLWEPAVTRVGRIGNRWIHTIGVDYGQCAPVANHTNNFKVGQYVVYSQSTVDFDNISYGKRWSNITKNRLIGYQKSVLRLPFEGTAATAVQDRSYTFNGGTAGDPISDYDNDATIVGSARVFPSGVNGSSMRFPGTAGSYVKVPIDAGARDDFDVGNYMTVSAWFRTTTTPSGNKGLVMIDEFSTSWKLLLYMKGNSISFGVRHPRTYSRLDHEFTNGRYSDDAWHLVTGTYNRFAPDGHRIKLYIDGQRVMQGAGYDLPILRGDNQLVVGKYSVDGFFQGYIDDVGLFNFAMTDQEVNALWLRRGAP